MGCVSSKLFKKDLQQEILFNNGGDYVNHVVSLTSSTYGALKLDKEQQQQLQQQQQPAKEVVEVVAEAKILRKSPPREDPEVINAWELMEGLEEQVPVHVQAKKSPKARVFLRGFVGEIDVRSPLKFLHQMGSPRKAKSTGGKENRGRENSFGGGRVRRSEYSPKEILKPRNSSESTRKASPSLRISPRSNWGGSKIGGESGVLSRRRSLGPLFDPVLIASYEKELSEGEEQIKMIVSPHTLTRKQRSSRDCESFLELFEKKCPPGGENAVVIYTTTLRGIRKTFEDCNNVRSIIDSHHIHMFERDISMDSGFKEELRGLMGTKEVKVPLVFVKGRLIGGADQVVKLDEEGKLGVLFNGIPRALGGCEGCAGVRFVMCLDCCGSCKVLDEGKKKTVKCGECNENGLIHCPICC